MKDKKYIIGVVIIVLIFLVSLNPYLLIFSVPVFVVGVIVLWISKKSVKTKLFWTLTPLLLWYPSMFMYFYLLGIIGNATAQKLDFIFPENLMGRVAIVEKIDCGQKIIKINGREQLIFPDNGILLYQGELRSGYLNHKYYYIGKNGHKKEILLHYDYIFQDDIKDKRNTSEVGVWTEGISTSTVYQQDSLIDYRFMELIVSSKNILDKYYEFKYNERFDSMKMEAIKKCK